MWGSSHSQGPSSATCVLPSGPAQPSSPFPGDGTPASSAQPRSFDPRHDPRHHHPTPFAARQLCDLVLGNGLRLHGQLTAETFSQQPIESLRVFSLVERAKLRLIGLQPSLCLRPVLISWRLSAHRGPFKGVCDPAALILPQFESPRT